MTVKTSARIVLSERVSMSAARAVVVDPRARKSKIQVTRFLSFEVAKPEKEVSPGGLSEGSRARLGKLAAKKRGQAKDRNDFWKRVG